MPDPVFIGHWPEDGKPFLLFRAIELDQQVTICWTPTEREWRTVRHVLAGLSEVTNAR